MPLTAVLAGSYFGVYLQLHQTRCQKIIAANLRSTVNGGSFIPRLLGRLLILPISISPLANDFDGPSFQAAPAFRKAVFYAYVSYK